MPSCEVRFTEAPGHAIEIARDLLRQDFNRLIAAGGDGTINEVVNGFMQERASEAELAILPLGTGGDFQRTMGIRNVTHALEVLKTGVPHHIDVGKAGARYFINLVSFGMGGEVAARSGNILSPLGGGPAFLYATLAAFLTYHAKLVTLTLDGISLTARVTNIAVGNGRYHGGGMHVCPQAKLDDGLLEVTIIDDLGMLQLIRDLPVLYSDNLYKHPKAHHYRSKHIQAESAEPTRIEIDGEPLGTLPLEITILPQSLKLLMPHRVK